MKVGDLVKHGGLNDVVWYGIISKKKKHTDPEVWLNDFFYITWTFGTQGWFHAQELEVISESR